MSQAATASGYEPVPATAALTNPEDDETREYQKIIRFRDTVVSGKHPRIKVPASSVVKNATAIAITSASASQPPPVPSNAPERVATSSKQPPSGNNAANGHSIGNMQSFKANSQQPAVTIPPTSSAPPLFIPGVSRPSWSGSGSGSGKVGKPEIYPILLEKSDDLVKAEFQIQRQRLEKALKDQVEQRRISMRGNLQSSEQQPELDLSDILAKALTLVQATAPPSTAILPLPTANASEASDSFDENTFYSSQHDTPESRPSVPARDAFQDVQMQDAPTPTRPADSYAPSSRPMPSQPLPASTSRPPQTDVTGNISQGQSVGAQSGYSSARANAPLQIQGMASTSRTETRNILKPGHRRELLETQIISSDSRDASRSDNSGNTDSDQSADQLHLQNPQRPVPNLSFRQPEEPLIRAHNLEPFAPQPAHVSPLAVARRPPIRESDTSPLQRVPAQVTTLRQEHAVVISPESSPQGDKGSKKKHKKKNKRRADGRTQDAPGSPNIKPEPKSPSPLTAPPFIRPQKRPRRSGRQEAEIIYDEQMPDRPSSQLQQERYPPVPVNVERVLQGYEGLDYPYSRQVRPSVAPVTHRLESPLYEEQRPDGTIIRYVRRVPSPSAYADPYGAVAVEPRPVRTASYTAANPDVREVSTYPREGRMSVRPYADRARSRSPVIIERRSSAMPPPSAPRGRIVVDEYGHEYLEPVRTATVSRQSVMPSVRPGDHEVVYERAPIQATSRMPAPEFVGEDGIVYRRASPGYVPRRVITQPEYGTAFRSYRERDYPMQPMGPPSQEFVQIRGATEHRVTEHLPRDYLPRATSVRPVESVPYDRLPSTRPDIPPRQYAASVHPDARREAAPHVVRDYSVRPAEMDIPQRAYSVRPVERYYEQPPREGNITYIERPRAVHQEVLYPGNGTPSQVYQ